MKTRLAFFKVVLTKSQRLLMQLNDTIGAHIKTSLAAGRLAATLRGLNTPDAR
jgi:hypothetical protein